MALVGWVDDTTITGDEWPDFDTIDPDTKTRLLTAAHEQLAVYAPPLPEPVPPAVQVIPERYRAAQILQAQENWAATRREGDVLGFGDEGYAVRVRPLTSTVKQMLRPRRLGPGSVG